MQGRAEIRLKEVSENSSAVNEQDEDVRQAIEDG